MSYADDGNSKVTTAFGRPTVLITGDKLREVGDSFHCNFLANLCTGLDSIDHRHHRRVSVQVVLPDLDHEDAITKSFDLRRIQPTGTEQAECKICNDPPRLARLANVLANGLYAWHHK
jgi:hypothetical protein